ELRCLEPPADGRELGLRALDEIFAEVGAESPFRAASQGPELVHREDAGATPDALAAVEDRRTARDENERGDCERDRQREEQEERGEEDVERSQDDVARPRRRLERKLAVAADEGVLDPRRVWHVLDRKAGRL